MKGEKVLKICLLRKRERSGDKNFQFTIFNFYPPAGGNELMINFQIRILALTKISQHWKFKH